MVFFAFYYRKCDNKSQAENWKLRGSSLSATFLLSKEFYKLQMPTGYHTKQYVPCPGIDLAEVPGRNESNLLEYILAMSSETLGKMACVLEGIDYAVEDGE